MDFLQQEAVGGSFVRRPAGPPRWRVWDARVVSTLWLWAGRQEPHITAVLTAVVLLGPMILGLATVRDEPPWLYVSAVLISVAGGALAFAKGRADQRTRHEMVLERDRLIHERDALIAEKASLAQRLAHISSALRGLEAGQMSAESFVGFLLEELHLALDLERSRVSFLAYRNESMLEDFGFTHSEPDVVMLLRGTQVGEHTPITWQIRKGTDAHRLALRCMRDLAPERMLRGEKVPRLSGQSLEMLRGPDGGILPDAWCRAPVVRRGSPIGLICIDCFIEHEWTNAELKLIAAFSTLLGLGFR